MILRKIKGLHIDGRKEMSLQSEIIPFLNPKFVYFPTVSGNVIYKPVVSVGDKVLKGQVILQRTDRFAHPVCSSVSGEVTAVKKMWHPFGKMVEMLEIKNDFEEKTVESWGQPLTELTKETIVKRVQEAGIVGLGGAGFPTFVKYQPVLDIHTLIVNAAECEPYLTCDYQSMKYRTLDLIHGIQYAMIATGAKEAKICIKKTKKEVIEILRNACAETENISVFPINDVYPAGWERYQVEAVTGKKYQNLPNEIGVVINNAQTLIAVAEAVEQNKPLIERVVTVTGEGLKNPCNLYVKVGTKLSDVIEVAGGYKEDVKDAYFVVGGPMTGKSIMFDEVVICGATGAVIVKPKKEHASTPCMGCGKCAEKCPAFLTPTEIKAAHENNDMVALEKLNVKACCQCGLCSYVCPARVEMTEFVGKAKDAYMKSVALKARK